MVIHLGPRLVWMRRNTSLPRATITSAMGEFMEPALVIGGITFCRCVWA